MLGGWIVGVVAVMLIAGIGELFRLGDQLAVGLGMGWGVGLAGWLAGRKWFGATSEWMWASAAGMGVPFVLSDLFGMWRLSVHMPVLIMLNAALGGLLVGLWQRRMLPSGSRRTIWWVVAAVVGWTLAGLVPMLVMVGGHPHTALALWRNVGGLLLGGVVLGVVTGGALLWALPPAASAPQA